MAEAQGAPEGEPRPSDWSASDDVLQEQIRSEMRRLAQDEEWIARNEQRIRRDWWVTVASLALAVLAITAIVLSVVALNRDIEAVSKSSPKDDSVGTGALKDGAVTPSKIAPGAVGAPALAGKAVTGGKIAPGAVDAAALAAKAVTAGKLAPGAVSGAALAGKAVTAGKVADDALTGAQIDESTLGRVRAARTALTLDGLTTSAFLTGVRVLRAATDRSSAALKGPTVVSCPSGTRLLGGGAAVEGADNVGLVQSAPNGTTGWTASAARMGPGAVTSWRLVVSVVCGTFGKP